MRTFSDIGQTIAVHLGIERLANGKAAELLLIEGVLMKKFNWLLLAFY